MDPSEYLKKIKKKSYMHLSSSHVYIILFDACMFQAKRHREAQKQWRDNGS